MTDTPPSSDAPGDAGFDPARERFAAKMFDALWTAFVCGDREIEIDWLIEGLAVEAGLVVKVPFDPEIHTDDSGACEFGDDYYLIAPAGRELIRMARNMDRGASE